MWRLSTGTPLQTRIKPVVHVSRSPDPPIYRLPVEILGKIFLLLLPRSPTIVDKIPEMYKNTSKSLLPPAPHRTLWQNATEAPSWTDILYVCQHWRAVAVNYPALWTQLTHNPAWVIECIRRSRQMPLELCIEQTEANLHAALIALQMAIPHFYRVREAKIVAGHHDFMEFAFECFEMMPAPRLETLSLACRGCEEVYEDFYWLERPEALFARQMPNLRSVDLNHYCRLQVPPSAPFFCSLTHLEISQPLLWKLESMADVVSCMAHWTSLETLVLKEALPWDLAHAGPTPPIRTDSDAATCVDQFLRHLVLPPYVSLYLDCELFDVNAKWGARDVDPTVVALSLLENVPVTVVHMIDNLEVLMYKDIFEVTGRRHVTSFSDSDDSDEEGEDYQDQDQAQVKALMPARPCPGNADALWNAQLNLMLRGNKNNNALPGDVDPTDAVGPLDYFGSVLGQLNFTRVGDLTLHIDRCFSKETWLRVLGPMRRLENLRFRCSGVGRSGVSLLHGFFEAFAGDVPPESAPKYDLHPGDAEFGSSPHLMCGLLLPRLRLLDVHVANVDQATWRRLLAVLRHRFVAGSQLQLLVAWGKEDDRYRPDEQTREELGEILDEKMIWRVVDVISECDEAESEGDEGNDELSRINGRIFFIAQTAAASRRQALSTARTSDALDTYGTKDDARIQIPSAPPWAWMESVVHIPRSTDPPIFRLPVEILGIIFHLLLPKKSSLRDEIIGTDVPEPLSPSRTPCQWQNATEAPSWTDILYVCRRWRTFALNYPALWTQLTHNPAWTKECIRRSRQMSLELSIEQTMSNPYGAIKALQMAMPHFSRMTDVQIIAAQHGFMAFVYQCFQGTPAPRLEALLLACRGCVAGAIFNSEECHWLARPEMLFAQQTPRLRLLDLALDCLLQIPPSAPLFRSLTHLEIRYPILWRHGSMADFIACVATWTNLETLVLQGALPYEPVTSGPTPPYPLQTPDRARRITLPHLREISITGDAATTMDQFLRHFDLPPHVLLYLDCALYDSPSLDSWGPGDVDPTVVALSLLENVPARAVRTVTEVTAFLGDNTLEIIGRAKPRDADDFDGSDVSGEDDADDEDLVQFDDEDGLLEAQLHVILRENDDSDDDEAPTAAAELHACYLRRDQRRPRAPEGDVAARAGPHVRARGPGHFRCKGPGEKSVSLLSGFLEAFAGDMPPESDTDVDGEHKHEYELDWDDLLLPNLRLLGFYAANFSAAMWRRLVAGLRRRLVTGSQLQMLIVVECEGEEGMHRPDKQILGELNELLEEDVVWK
ncbi:hypothetical protein EVG20_g1776, partial [Dentipellis fragilis]